MAIQVSDYGKVINLYSQDFLSFLNIDLVGFFVILNQPTL